MAYAPANLYGTDPKKASAAARQYAAQGGAELMSEEDRRIAEEQAKRGQTADYLGGIYDPMARGEGGYSADEAAGNYLSGGEQAAIADQAGLDALDPNAQKLSSDFLSKYEMTPEQQQDIVTGAGISAGTGYRAAIGDTERAARAAGVSPLGLATYRSRNEREAAGEAGDAMTKARIQASGAAADRLATGEQMRQQGEGAAFGAGLDKSNTQSGRALTLGSNRQATNMRNADTRLGKQSEGLNYYQGQNAQANQNANSSADRKLGTYQTQTGAVNQTLGTTQAASQNPSTFSKVMGGIGGALSFLEDGQVITSPTVAVVGEKGPEAVVPLNGNPQAKVRPSIMGDPLSRYGQPQGDGGAANYQQFGAGVGNVAQMLMKKRGLDGYRAA